jgi:aspartyl-tRNA(Asn)/glutamyl-tRNA(Gln) amidotransferase subunit A
MTSETEPAVEEPSPPVPTAVAAEFETMTRRLGIEVPPHLLRGVLLGYRGLRDMAELLRTAESGLPTSLSELSIAEAGALLRSGELTSDELTRDALARIAELDPTLHSFVLVTEQVALRRAAQADRELSAGIDRGPMQGIPYALKDIFNTRGIATTNGSWLTHRQMPTEDSTVESRLSAGGGVLLGKLTTYEFAVGGPSFDLPSPPARNPWSSDHVPSGSSSGAGAAVAAGLVRVAIASDTSGSTRGPAFHCGAVGLKPTYGRVSGAGAQPLSHTMDHFGPLAWTVADAAAALRVIAGGDPRDPRTVDVPVPDYLAELSGDVSGLKIAWSPTWYAHDPATMPEVVAVIEQALAVLEHLGATVTEVEPPAYDLFNACGRVIMAAEAFAVHEDNLRRNPGSFGRFTYQRLMPGAGIGAADLLRAYEVRRQLTRALQQRVFGNCDVLITACGQTTAARFSDFPEDWPPPKLANDMQTIPFNVSGHPALSLPTGLAANSLPIGLQVVGRPFDESTMFRVATVLETELGQRHRRPPTPTSGHDESGGEA